MTDAILSQRTQKFNTIYKILNEMAFDSEEKLVLFCRSKGHSDAEIARALGMSRQNLGKKYPNSNTADKVRNDSRTAPVAMEGGESER